MSSAPNSTSRLIGFPAICNPQGQRLCECIDIFSLLCLGCGLPIRNDHNPPFYALGPPYYSLCHRDCIHTVTWNGQFPHPAPLSSYLTNVPANERTAMIGTRPPSGSF